jgi:hypothetical protein
MDSQQIWLLVLIIGATAIGGLVMWFSSRK